MTRKSINSMKTKRRQLRNKLLRSRELRRIHTRSIQSRSRKLKKIHSRSIKHVKSKYTKRKSKIIKNKRISFGPVSFRYGGSGPVSLLPTPYKMQAMESGASTPQQSAIIAQRNADLLQNENNNMIGGEGEEDTLPVVQFSGKNSAVTNQQSVQLTNILAQNRAAGVGDADVSKSTLQ